jgi:hypothetical protein
MVRGHAPPDTLFFNQIIEFKLIFFLAIIATQPII